MLLAASFKQSSLDELLKMDPLERDFIAYWMRQKEYDQMEQFGRLMGVLFNAGEVRSWSNNKATKSPTGFEDEDTILVPLSFMLRPESRESIQKMVGTDGMALPEGYRKREGEIVVDLGKVSPEEFKAFVESNRVVTPS